MTNTNLIEKRKNTFESTCVFRKSNPKKNTVEFRTRGTPHNDVDGGNELENVQVFNYLYQ